MARKRKGSQFYWASYTDHRGERIRESTGFTRKEDAEAVRRFLERHDPAAHARGLRVASHAWIKRAA